MTKPTVFFSHSSQDKGQLSRLKEAFCNKTGGAIDVFLSSDGQSIPLGTNWVYRVQEGLEGAKLMLVFITPNSIGSRWVYFEAGYSYAKDIRVIPIGFLGVDLSQLGPPLSLLQGFNITSADTLNNLIALANEEFGHKHSLAFLPQDYDRIVGEGETALTGAFREILHYLEEIRLYLTKREGLRAEPEQLLREINELLNSAAVEHQSSKSFIHMRGVVIYVELNVSPRPINIVADPIAIHATLPTLIQIIGSIRNDGVQGIGFEFRLAAGMEVVEEDHKITARLYDSEVRFRPEGGLVFRKFLFSTGYSYRSGRDLSRRMASVTITPTSAEFYPEDAADLFKLLLASKVIYQVQDGLP